MISPELWVALSSLWPLQNNIGPLSRIKPWAIALLLPTLLTQKCEGVEGYLKQRAAFESKPIGYLETCEEFSNKLDAVPTEILQGALRKVLDNIDKAPSYLASIYDAWQRFDLNALNFIATGGVIGIPQIRKVMLDDRNHSWIDRIRIAISSERKCTAFVGAFHLVGRNNLTELIEKQVGHRVSLIAD